MCSRGCQGHRYIFMYLHVYMSPHEHRCKPVWVSCVLGKLQVSSNGRVVHTSGQGLGTGELAVPVLLYGKAHCAGRTLADIRRACGYFKGAQQGRQ